jgi:hypothetical protein
MLRVRNHCSISDDHSAEGEYLDPRKSQNAPMSAKMDSTSIPMMRLATSLMAKQTISLPRPIAMAMSMKKVDRNVQLTECHSLTFQIPGRLEDDIGCRVIALFVPTVHSAHFRPGRYGGLTWRRFHHQLRSCLSVSRKYTLQTATHGWEPDI